ncbi:CD209 antigen-like [Channa argus]|uniref:CD209 antigen-like n=1 Tax=Channa argus TaxID=215402 RepID=UPI0035204783
MSYREGNKQESDGEAAANRRSKVTSERVALLVLSGLLAAAAIVIYRLSFDHFHNKKILQTLKENNETMMKTLQTLKNENEAMKKNLTECLSEINQGTRLQPMCPEPTEVKTTEPCQKCEEGWELHGGKCYYFSNKPSSWKQRIEECVHHGGDLVKIDSREEQSFLVERLRNKMNESEDKFWIGLTDSQEVVVVVVGRRIRTGHKILLSTLSDFGITGAALAWLSGKMSEAEVLYSDVRFTRARGNGKEATSSSEETTYSEIKILKTQPPAEQPATSQQVESNKRSKVTSDRVPLLVLSVLLTAAVIGLCVVCFDHFQTKKTLQTMKNENETMMKTLQTLKTENEAMKKNLTDEPCQKCEEGWELHGGKCYYFSNKPSSWNQSREECVRRGGDLVKIDSREEQSFLEERLRNKMNEAEDKFWIGLTDSREEGRWLWVDGSELDTSLTFWSRNEPDNWKRNNGDPDGEDCVRMGEKGGADDLKCWFDQSCNNPHKSICEKAAQTGRYVCNCSL